MNRLFNSNHVLKLLSLKLLCYVLLCASLLLLAASAIKVAFAHEQRTIGGKYAVEVGWDKEPAVVGLANGAAISITRDGNPVEGVEKTLKVQVAYGGNTPREFELHDVEDKKGYYVADIIPTRTGSYIFTFVGKIEDTDVNEKFESGPGRFNDVTGTETLQVPAVTTTSDTSNDLAGVRTLAIIGTVTGILGLVVGGIALATRRRA